MDILLDTHTLIWTLFDSDKLPKDVLSIIEDEENRIYVSGASLWEIAIKNAKKPNQMPYTFKDIYNIISTYTDFNIIDVHYDAFFELDKVIKQYKNNDPFDHILVATAIEEKMLLITHDKLLGEINNKYIYAY